MFYEKNVIFRINVDDFAKYFFSPNPSFDREPLLYRKSLRNFKILLTTFEIFWLQKISESRLIYVQCDKKSPVNKSGMDLLGLFSENRFFSALMRVGVTRLRVFVFSSFMH